MKNKTVKNNQKNQKRRSASNVKLYSVGLVEEDNKYKLVDAFILQRINQYKQEWKRANARQVAKLLNDNTIR